VLLPLFALLLADPHPLMREYNRAWQLVGQRRAGEAIPLLKAIIGKDKSFYRAYEFLARAYSHDKQFEAAETYFRSLIAEDPSNGLAHFGLGRVYEERGKRDSAWREFAACTRKPVRCHRCFVHFPGARVRAPIRSNLPGDQLPPRRRCGCRVRRSCLRRSGRLLQCQKQLCRVLPERHALPGYIRAGADAECSGRSSSPDRQC